MPAFGKVNKKQPEKNSILNSRPMIFYYNNSEHMLFE